MTGRMLMLIGSLLALYMAFRGLDRGGFGWRVRFHLQSILFWMVAAVILLVISGAPAVRQYCLGC